MSADANGAPVRKITRRLFLASATVAGAGVALIACTQNQPSPTPAVTSTAAPPSSAKPAASSPAAAVATPPAATPAASAATPAASVPSPAASPAATGPVRPLTAQRLSDKPLPEQFFNLFGSNAETKLEVLGRTFTTPNGMFFVRSHVASVLVDPKAWRLKIEGSGVQRPVEVTYDELLKMPATTVTRFVECSGNGRSFYQTLMNRPASGTQWKFGGFGIAEWTGVKVSELINRAGLKTTAKEVMAIGLDQPNVRRPIPVERAMADDALVAYMMNGDILPIDHGFPARTMIPGMGGINSIKWVGTIQVTEEANKVEWNTNSYVLIGPDYPPPPGEKGPPANDQVMKSALALPWPANLTAGRKKVTGYAWSPVGKISKVEVSADGGRTYAQARLIEPNVEKAGVRWEFEFDARPGDMTLTPRATDDKGNVQPTLEQQKWNQLGYFFGVVVPHPVKVA